MSLVTISKRPVLPVIEINKSGGGVYTFNHFLGTYDFRPRYVSIKPAVDNKGGRFEIKCSSSDASNSNANAFLNNIIEGDELLLYIGKTNAGKAKIMRGIMETIEIQEESKDYMELTISGPDWGSDLLKNRIINGSWTQKKLANGIDVDTTDLNTTIKQIVIDALTKSQYYPSVDGITAESNGLVVSAGNITPPTIQIPQFESNMEHLDDKLQELDDFGNCMHYVDPDKNFIMKPVFDTVASDVLLVDDYSDAVALGWDQTKLGLIQPITKYKRTLENHKRRIFGLGGDDVQLDQKQETTSGSTGLDANYLAQKFTPIYTTCHSIGVYVGKTAADPATDLQLYLIEDNGGNPTGSTLRTLSKKVSAILTAGDWTYFPIGEKLNTSKSYWIVLVKMGDATHTYNWFKDAGSTRTNAYSSDGVSWTVQASSFGFAFREYTSSPLLQVLPATVSASQKHFHEEVYRRADVTTRPTLNKLLIAMSATLFAKKEIFKSKIYAPDTVLLPGQSVRIRKNLSGYQIDAGYTIGDIEYIFEGSDDKQTGAFNFEMEASLFNAYA